LSKEYDEITDQYLCLLEIMAKIKLDSSNFYSQFRSVTVKWYVKVENLHRILSRTRVKARPSVLWCYKKELGFSTHRKKRMREIKRNQSRGLHDPDRDDPFDLFISSTDIRWTYYKESEKILGQTFGSVYSL